MDQFEVYLTALLQDVFRNYPYDEDKAKKIFDNIIKSKKDT